MPPPPALPGWLTVYLGDDVSAAQLNEFCFLLLLVSFCSCTAFCGREFVHKYGYPFETETRHWRWRKLAYYPTLEEDTPRPRKATGPIVVCLRDLRGAGPERSLAYFTKLWDEEEAAAKKAKEAQEAMMLERGRASPKGMPEDERKVVDSDNTRRLSATFAPSTEQEPTRTSRCDRDEVASEAPSADTTRAQRWSTKPAAKPKGPPGTMPGLREKTSHGDDLGAKLQLSSPRQQDAPHASPRKSHPGDARNGLACEIRPSVAAAGQSAEAAFECEMKQRPSAMPSSLDMDSSAVWPSGREPSRSRMPEPSSPSPNRVILSHSARRTLYSDYATLHSPPDSARASPDLTPHSMPSGSRRHTARHSSARTSNASGGSPRKYLLAAIDEEANSGQLARNGQRYGFVKPMSYRPSAQSPGHADTAPLKGSVQNERGVRCDAMYSC